MKKVTLVFICLFSGFLAGSLLQCRNAVSGTDNPDPLKTQEASRPVEPVKIISTAEEATIHLFEEAAPTVVFITTTAVQQDYLTRNISEIPAGTGSGFIWDEVGHIVTNFHVIRDAYRATVTLSDQKSYEAEVVGVEPSKDLAVLKINPPEHLKPIPLGTSHDLKVGQSVFAIGNPFGLDQTLTTGIISALGRQIQSAANIPIRDVIQTDAAINPGNSGGPLLDISGRLIGVNTAIYSPSGTYAGIGFSVPVDIVRWVVPDLIRYGKVQRPVLGVELAQKGLTDRLQLKGTLIMDITPGSGAAKAGLRPTRRSRRGEIELGDVIIGIDETAIDSFNDLFLALEKYKPGDTVTVKISRDNKILEVPVVLGSSL